MDEKKFEQALTIQKKIEELTKIAEELNNEEYLIINDEKVEDLDNKCEIKKALAFIINDMVGKLKEDFKKV